MQSGGGDRVEARDRSRRPSIEPRLGAGQTQDSAAILGGAMTVVVGPDSQRCSAAEQQNWWHGSSYASKGVGEPAAVGA
jgi:hypothetical protein